MKKNVLLLLMFISVSASAQFNIDSLRFLVKGNYILKSIPKKTKSKTIRVEYINHDSLLCFVFTQNEKEEVVEDIMGIALSEYKYDSKHRMTELKYYNEKGELSFSETPPILKIEYDSLDRIISRSFFIDNSYTPVKGGARIEYDYNQFGDLTEERAYNENKELRKNSPITKYEYLDDRKTQIERRYDKDTVLIVTAEIAAKCDRFETNKREKLIERKFLGVNKNLVVRKDYSSGLEYSILKYEYGLKPEYVKVVMYDKNMKKINESWQYSPDEK